MNPDRTEVLELGNHSIDPGTWTGMPDTADGHAAPLPVYPKPEGLPPQPITAEMRREAAIWTLHDLACLACFAAFAWLAFPDRLARAVSYLLTFVVLPGLF